MPMTPREAEKFRYDKEKRKIATDFSVAWRTISLGEGISAAMIAVLEGAIAVVLALLLMPEPAITKATAALVAAGAGLFGAIIVMRILLLSGELFLNAVLIQTGAESREDQRHADALAAMSD